MLSTTPAPHAPRQARKEKAAFLFAFLGSVMRDKEMQRIDLAAAVDFSEWADDDLTFFRSARALGAAVGCSESTAEASLRRFRDRGYLCISDTAKATSTSNGGRLANTYTMTIPDSVSPGKSGKTTDEVSPGKSGKTKRQKRAVSPNSSGRVSPENSGTISIDKSLDGGRALGRATASPSSDDGAVIEDYSDAERDITALDGPNITLPNHRSEPASDVSLASDDYLQCYGAPVTLADLDRLASEEQAATELADDVDFIDDATKALANLHDEIDADFAGLVGNFLTGFGSGDPSIDDERAARIAVEIEVEIMDLQGADDRQLWLDHGRILANALSLINGGDHAQASASVNSLLRAAWRELNDDRCANVI